MFILNPYILGSPDPAATAYFADVATAGGALTDADKAGWNTFFTTLRTAGLLAKVKELWVPTSDTLAGKLVKALYLGGNSSCTANNVVLGDFDDVFGVTGNGSNKWIGTVTVPNTYGITAADGSLGVYICSGWTGVNLGNGSTYHGYDGDHVNFGAVAGLGKDERLHTAATDGANLKSYHGKFKRNTVAKGSGGTSSAYDVLRHGGSGFYSEAQVSGCFIGTSLTESDVEILSDAFDALIGSRCFANQTNTAAFLGDSITAGELSPHTDNWSSIVSTAIGMTEGNAGISGSFLQEIGSYAAGGASTGRRRGLRNVATKKPKRVYVNYGVNDLLSVNASYTASDYQTQLIELLTIIKTTCGLSYQDIIVGSPSYLTGSDPTEHAAYVAATIAAASAVGCKYAAVWEAMNSGGGNSLLSDGVHPTAAGHIVIANAMLAAV